MAVDNKEIQYTPITKKKINEEAVQIKKVKTEKTNKADLARSIKRLAFIGGMACALWGGKSIVSDINHFNQVNKSFEVIEDEARKTLNSSASGRLNASQTEYVYQYDAHTIAKQIEAYCETKGEVYKEALVAEVMHSLPENKEQNMEQVLNWLGEEVSTKEDYVHELGYETKRDYLNAMKENIYQETEKGKVQEKYEEGRKR